MEYKDEEDKGHKDGLKKFNPKAICPTCGFKTVSSKYSEYNRIMSSKGKVELLFIMSEGHKLRECIVRTCCRCEYQWIEGCL